MNINNIYTSNIKRTTYNMINISNKCISLRRACVSGTIYVGKEVFNLIKEHKIEKGDVLSLAEIAGINAAKKTSSFILLCHQVNIENIFLNLIMDKDTYSISAYCIVFANAKTGVEMEAMIGVCAALSTIYDLTKKKNPHSVINNIELLFKDGGENGLVLGSINKIPEHLRYYFANDNILFNDISILILSISERAVKGVYDDYSGELIKDYFKIKNGYVLNKIILPDDYSIIKSLTKKLINTYNPNLFIITGGTGISHDDITNNVISNIAKPIPGIAEFLRFNGTKYTHTSWLSASSASVYNKTLILSLPGNTSAVFEALNSLTKLLLHSLDIIKNL